MRVNIWAYSVFSRESVTLSPGGEGGEVLFSIGGPDGAGFDEEIFVDGWGRPGSLTGSAIVIPVSNRKVHCTKNLRESYSLHLLATRDSCSGARVNLT